MYGDDYEPEDKERYGAACNLFDTCESRDELRHALIAVLFDLNYPRQDLHVAHKRACLKNGWKL